MQFLADLAQYRGDGGDTEAPDWACSASAKNEPDRSEIEPTSKNIIYDPAHNRYISLDGTLSECGGRESWLCTSSAPTHFLWARLCLQPRHNNYI